MKWHRDKLQVLLQTRIIVRKSTLTLMVRVQHAEIMYVIFNVDRLCTYFIPKEENIGGSKTCYATYCDV
jgi:hypothetical protein